MDRGGLVLVLTGLFSVAVMVAGIHAVPGQDVPGVSADVREEGGTIHRFKRYDPSAPVNFTLVPGASGFVDETSWKPYNVTLGPDGYRDTIPERHPERVLVLGDTFTFGVGVAGNDTWPAVLDRSLDNVSVINAAKPGAGFPDYLEVLRHRDWSEIDVVVTGVVMNDYYASHVAREMNAVIDTSEQGYIEALNREQAERFPERVRDDRLLGFAQEARAWGREQGVPVVFYVIQDTAGYTDPFHARFDHVVEPPRRYLRSQGPEDPSPYHMAPWYAHPNEAGHRVLADRIAAYLTGEGLVRD